KVRRDAFARGDLAGSPRRSSQRERRRESGARKKLAHRRSSWGFAACAPRVICLVDRRKLRGVPTEPRRAMRSLRQADKASITEAASMKIGVYSSLNRVAPGPILATLGMPSALGA